MDKDRLNDILSMDDSIISMQDLVVTERLSVKYPYCSVFKVLVTKFAFILNNFNKNALLQTTGIYVSDREHLKKILSEINLHKSQLKKIITENNRDDIITKINSYEDEQLSDNPTKQELLEKFLKIENPKNDSQNNNSLCEDKNIESAIKQSASKEFKIVTETMAKVYAKQGDKTKAIKIYKQLMTDNPQKEMYYANQIEILKNN